MNGNNHSNRNNFKELESQSLLMERIMSVLYEKNRRENYFSHSLLNASKPSAVLFLLGNCAKGDDNSYEPCLILNKRSQMVNQPGDLCCPGGGVSPRLDSLIARLLTLPGSPMIRWPYWSASREESPPEFRRMASLFATCLREGFEEMRLNPFGIQFLGPLPSQSLVMFKRVIYPLAGWVNKQKNFSPNWEVDKIIYIPLRSLLDPENYARFRLVIPPQNGGEPIIGHYPCYLAEDETGRELLWGATFRIVTRFLKLVFGFTPPAETLLPEVRGNLNSNYFK